MTSSRRMTLALAPLLLATHVDAATIIHAGRLIDGGAADPRTEVSIVIEKDRITRVAKGYIEAGAGDTVIDLKQHTVLPGLMDMHVHLLGELSPQGYSEGFFLNPADVALRATLYAERTLMAGFTTVRDLGGRDHVSLSLRNAIDKGWIVGPRVFAAGKALATTGGHADPTNGLAYRFRGDPGPREGVVNGPLEARKAVRQRYKDGSDLIKLTATGGVLSLAKSGDNPQFQMDELEAIVETAREYGMTVAVHAHGAEGMRRAVTAGVDSIEHGTYMTDEIMELMKEQGTFWVPTITAGRYVAMKAEEPGFLPEVVRPKARAIGPVIEETFARAYEAGVTIAFGTDTGVSPHGSNGKEFGYMVEGGMLPLEAIRSATSVAARLLKIDDRFGTIEVGKIADIVAVPGDPVAEIGLMEKIEFVMKDGKVFKQPGSCAPANN